MQDVRGRYASDGEFTRATRSSRTATGRAAEQPSSPGLGRSGRHVRAFVPLRDAVACRRDGAARGPSVIAGVSRFHYLTEAQERPAGRTRVAPGWRQVQIGAERPNASACLGSCGSPTEAMARTHDRPARSGELMTCSRSADCADLPGGEGAGDRRHEQPSRRPLYRRPWPDDTYERIHADTFHLGGGTTSSPPARCAIRAMLDVAGATGRRPPGCSSDPGPTALTSATRAARLPRRTDVRRPSGYRWAQRRALW